MDLTVADYSGILSLAVTITVAVCQVFYSVLDDLQSRKTIYSWFCVPLAWSRYAKLLTSFIFIADSRIGRRFSLRSFDRCVLFAVTYTVTFFCISWCMGGSGTIGSVALVPLDTPIFARVVWLSLLVVSSVGLPLMHRLIPRIFWNSACRRFGTKFRIPSQKYTEYVRYMARRQQVLLLLMMTCYVVVAYITIAYAGFSYIFVISIFVTSAFAGLYGYAGAGFIGLTSIIACLLALEVAATQNVSIMIVAIGAILFLHAANFIFRGIAAALYDNKWFYRCGSSVCAVFASLLALNAIFNLIKIQDDVMYALCLSVIFCQCLDLGRTTAITTIRSGVAMNITAIFSFTTFIMVLTIMLLAVAAGVRLYRQNVFVTSEAISMSAAVFLLFVAMPLANSLFDWISLDVTRKLLASLVRSNSRLRALFHVILNIVLAVALAVFLLTTLGWCAWQVERNYGILGGHSLYWKSAVLVFTQKPWTEGFFVTGMVLVTLLPIIVHICAAVLTILLKPLPGRAWVLRKLDQEHIMRLEKCAIIAWFGGGVLISLAIVATWTVFFYLVAQRVMDMNITEWLGRFALLFWED